MNRLYGFLFILIICMATSDGKDWLEGGYADRGDYGDTGKYFSDPLFFPKESNPYAIADPAVRNMLISLDMPRESIPGPADPAVRQMEASLDYPRYYGASGRMVIMLSDGTTIDLMLYQYQNTINGQGSLNLDGRVQWATARGYMYNSNLQIDVMPTNSNMQYTISIDTSRRDMPGRYTLYKYGIQPCSGTANARWLSLG